MKREHVGSDFDDFLKQDGLLAECEATAFKRVVTWQLEQEMKRRKISRAKLASRMNTSRAALDGLFSKDHSSVTLQLLEETALALEGLIAWPDRATHAAAMDRGLAWLVERVEKNEHRNSSPIGFYFAKLWYYEELYPLIFTVSTLRQALLITGKP